MANVVPQEVRPTALQRLALAPKFLLLLSMWGTALEAVWKVCSLFGWSPLTYCAAVAVATLLWMPVSLIVLHGDVDNDNHDVYHSLTLPTCPC